MGVPAMKPAAVLVENAGLAVSELAMLSSDPALTFRSDPTFCAKFRNADEIIESDFKQIEVGSHSGFTSPSSWTGTTLWRRSPKD
jgi:hypothetical protein